MDTEEDVLMWCHLGGNFPGKTGILRGNLSRRKEREIQLQGAEHLRSAECHSALGEVRKRYHVYQGPHGKQGQVGSVWCAERSWVKAGQLKANCSTKIGSWGRTTELWGESLHRLRENKTQECLDTGSNKCLYRGSQGFQLHTRRRFVSTEKRRKRRGDSSFEHALSYFELLLSSRI